MNHKLIFQCFFILLLQFSIFAYAGPTKVGNGDDGADLEKTQKVNSGILISTRDQAIDLLNKLNVRGITHLGNLIDEVQKADIYLVQDPIKNPKKFDQGMEVSEDGQNVYARTFASPYSPVRFFPPALLLSQEQLVRLHIHEGLHRSLPKSVNENESIVSEITLLLTAPNANRDQISNRISQIIPEPNDQVTLNNINILNTVVESPYTENIRTPSKFTYEYISYFSQEKDQYLLPLLSMNRIRNYMHPFGGKNEAIGVGLGFSYLSLMNDAYMGPLELSGRMKVATWKKFDFELWGELALYTLSDEELKTLPQVRDTFTTGLSMRKDEDFFYTENFISITAESKKINRITSTEYTYKYAPIIDARVSAGARYERFFFGGVADFILTESVSVIDDEQNQITRPERVRIVKAGAEIGYRYKQLSARIYGQKVLNSTKGYNLTDLSSLVAHGSGQGFAGTELSYHF